MDYYPYDYVAYCHPQLKDWEHYKGEYCVYHSMKTEGTYRIRSYPCYVYLHTTISVGIDTDFEKRTPLHELRLVSKKKYDLWVTYCNLKELYDKGITEYVIPEMNSEININEMSPYFDNNIFKYTKRDLRVFMNLARLEYLRYDT